MCLSKPSIPEPKVVEVPAPAQAAPPPPAPIYAEQPTPVNYEPPKLASAEDKDGAKTIRKANRRGVRAFRTDLGIPAGTQEKTTGLQIPK